MKIQRVKSRLAARQAGSQSDIQLWWMVGLFGVEQGC